MMLVMKLDAVGYHRLSPPQRQEVEDWLIENDLEPNNTQAYEVLGEGVVAVTVLLRGEDGRVNVVNGELENTLQVIHPTRRPPYFNPR